MLVEITKPLYDEDRIELLSHFMHIASRNHVTALDRSLIVTWKSHSVQSRDLHELEMRRVSRFARDCTTFD